MTETFVFTYFSQFSFFSFLFWVISWKSTFSIVFSSGITCFQLVSFKKLTENTEIAAANESFPSPEGFGCRCKDYPMWRNNPSLIHTCDKTADGEIGEPWNQGQAGSYTHYTKSIYSSWSRVRDQIWYKNKVNQKIFMLNPNCFKMVSYQQGFIILFYQRNLALPLYDLLSGWK